MTDAKLSVGTSARFGDPLRVLAFVALSLATPAARAVAQLDTLAQRQDSVSPDDLKTLSVEELMNVVVTSVSGRAEPLSQVASAIQVITQDDIRRSGATSLPEALRLASNLQVAQVDSRQWAISARGFNGTTANKLLVLIDGGTAGAGVSYRVYGKGFARDATALPSGLDGTDDWSMGQGGFRVDWDASRVNRVSLQGDAYGGLMSQSTGKDVVVNGGNVVGKW